MSLDRGTTACSSRGRGTELIAVADATDLRLRGVELGQQLVGGAGGVLEAAEGVRELLLRIVAIGVVEL